MRTRIKTVVYKSSRATYRAQVKLFGVWFNLGYNGEISLMYVIPDNVRDDAVGRIKNRIAMDHKVAYTERKEYASLPKSPCDYSIEQLFEEKIVGVVYPKITCLALCSCSVLFDKSEIRNNKCRACGKQIIQTK